MSKLSQYEHDYAALVDDILMNGTMRQTRNAVTKSVFGRQLRVTTPTGDLPILCGRRMYPKGVIGELAAMLKGPKTVQDFKDMGCNYWDKWAKPDGTIEVDYGNAWLDFNGVNQLDEVIESIRQDPYGRRHIISGWRPDRLKQLSLPCCHILYQWYVREGKLDMIWYQRSVDTMVGLPSDVLVAHVWNMLMAKETELEPGEIIMMLGDTHIYEPHFTIAAEYTTRVHRMGAGLEQFIYPCTTMRAFATVRHFHPSDVNIFGYQPLEKMNLELLV
jgi:thymidylate synthase